MHFRNEGEYNDYMQAQGEAEAQAQHEQDYHEYLKSLIDNKEYGLHAIEVIQDLINRKYDIKSGDSVQEFLSIEKAKLMIPKAFVELPF